MPFMIERRRVKRSINNLWTNPLDSEDDVVLREMPVGRMGTKQSYNPRGPYPRHHRRQTSQTSDGCSTKTDASASSIAFCSGTYPSG